MKKAAVVLFLLCALLASASAMAYTDVPFINGYVIYDHSINEYVSHANVWVCTTPYLDGWNCKSTISDYNGQYYFTSWGVPDDATIYIFGWTDYPENGRTGTWGSTTVPLKSTTACQYRDQYGWCHNYGVQASLTLEAAPLMPVAKYPAPGATGVPTTTPTFKWTSSSDSYRQYVNIVYEIWGSGYSSPMIRQVTDLPCNPDSFGRCQWTLPINLQPNTPYNWKIVAKAQYPYHTLVTESPTYHFTSGN